MTRPNAATPVPGRAAWRTAYPRSRLAAALFLAVLATAVLRAPPPHPAIAATAPAGAGLTAAKPQPQRSTRYADFGSEASGPAARYVADWVADSNDHAGTDFIVVDKSAAKVYVFDAQARLRAATPVLLGSARGDDTVPGIGSRPIDDVQPHERTTPAGRFVAERGRNASGEDVVWVDYDAAVSMHRVRSTVEAERRLQRLATPTIADNRISYGCINMPVAFYEANVRPIFQAQRAIVYVLPETKSAQQVFGSYDVAAAHAQRVSTAMASFRLP